MEEVEEKIGGEVENEKGIEEPKEEPFVFKPGKIHEEEVRRF
jgi:hypothetical protein